MSDALLSERPVAGLEIAGRVKWFDQSKGYGFVVPDGGGPDVMLSMAVLRRDGFATIQQNARLIAEAARGERGWQILRVIAFEQRATARRPRSPPACADASISGFEIVTLKWFNRARGFGFLSRGEGEADIFVHAELLRGHGLLGVEPGVALLARFASRPRGLVAAEVRPIRRVMPGSPR